MEKKEEESLTRKNKIVNFPAKRRKEAKERLIRRKTRNRIKNNV